MTRAVLGGLLVLLPGACRSSRRHQQTGATTTSGVPGPTTAAGGRSGAPASPPVGSSGKGYEVTVAASDGNRWQIDVEVVTLPRFEKDTENGSPGTAAIAYMTLGSAAVTFKNLLQDRPADLNRYLDPSVQVVGYWPAAACVTDEAGLELDGQQLCAKVIGEADFDHEAVPAGETRTYQMAENEYRNGTSPVAEESVVDKGLAVLREPPLYITVQGQPAALLKSCRTKEAMPLPLAIWDYRTGKTAGCQ